MASADRNQPAPIVEIRNLSEIKLPELEVGLFKGVLSRTRETQFRASLLEYPTVYRIAIYLLKLRGV